MESATPVVAETLPDVDWLKVPRNWALHACCDVVNRGAALQDNNLIFGTIDGRLVSLHAATGKLRWEVQTTDTSLRISRR